MAERIEHNFDRVEVKEIPFQRLDLGTVAIDMGDNYIVVAGEYADEGAPDLLVTVELAIDEEGDDIRETVARRIARLLAGL